jgi:hypothetical protein
MDNNANQGTSTGTEGQAGEQQQRSQQNAGNAGVDEATMAELKRKAGEFDKLDAIAKEVGGDDFTAVDHVEWLESKVYTKNQNQDGQNQDGQNQDDKQKQTQQQTPPQGQPGLSEDDRKLLTNALQAGYRGDLGAQYVEYLLGESNKTEADRTGFTKQELFEVVTKKAALVTELVRDAEHEGNVFSAAAEVLRIKKGRGTQQQQQGNASNQALENAQNSGSFNTEGTTQQPSSATPEQLAQQENAKLAREIAPRTVYVMPKD